LDSCQGIGERIAEIFKTECGASVSMGYAFHLKEMTPESLIREADKSLYRSKRGKAHQELANFNRIPTTLMGTKKG